MPHLSSPVRNFTSISLSLARSLSSPCGNVSVYFTRLSLSLTLSVFCLLSLCLLLLKTKDSRYLYRRSTREKTIASYLINISKKIKTRQVRAKSLSISIPLSLLSSRVLCVLRRDLSLTYTEDFNVAANCVLNIVSSRVH